MNDFSEKGILSGVPTKEIYDDKAEKDKADILTLSLDNEISRHRAVFGTLAPSPWQIDRAEFLKRLIKFARKRKISLLEPGWEHAAMVWAAWAHPELQPTKKLGRPRKHGSILTGVRGEIDPDIKALVEWLDLANAERKKAGEKEYSDLSLAQWMAVQRGGNQNQIASNTRTFANRLSKARNALGKRKRNPRGITKK